MDKIENRQQYDEAVKRVEELLPLINDTTPSDDPNYIEFVHLGNIVADYDEVHFSSVGVLMKYLMHNMAQLVHLKERNFMKK